MPVLRLAYAIEFLIALIATFILWSEVGGQGHLDMMPWYWKLFLGSGVAFACVRATAAAVERERAWNARTLKWLVITLALLLACGLVTYYYHVYEPAEEEEPAVTTAYWSTASSTCNWASGPLTRISLLPLES